MQQKSRAHRATAPNFERSLTDRSTDFETLTDRSTAAEDHKSLNAKPSAAGRFWRFTEKIPILTQFN